MFTTVCCHCVLTRDAICPSKYPRKTHPFLSGSTKMVFDMYCVKPKVVTDYISVKVGCQLLRGYLESREILANDNTNKRKQADN